MNRVNRRRRALAQALGAAALAAPWTLPRAQAYPSKPIRIVHGFDAGSNPDTVARIIGPALTERLGQPIIVESKPGAGGRIGTGYVIGQEPDGYTLMMLTAGDSVTAATDPKLPYDLVRDYAFISIVIQFPFVIMVSAESPLKTLRETLDAAKRSPGKLTFATPGIRTTQHLGGELLKVMAGIDLLHVPFKGNAFQEVIAGRVDLILGAPAVSTPHIKSGKVRPLAVTGRTRMGSLPDVPAVTELLAGYEVTSWLGLGAPARTNPAIVEKLSTEVRQVLARDDVRSRLVGLGAEPGGSTGDAFKARVESDIRKWKGLTEKARLDN